MISRGVLVSLLVTLCLHSSLVTADFTWSDCGVQLTKNIHYVSASISPSSVGASGPLSINVQASVTSKIYNTDTTLVVHKDGELYLDVKIQDLCTIISTTKSLSCPLSTGLVSFTYTFQSLPVLPVGHYTFQIKNADQGCLQLSGSAGSLIGDSNFQTSSFIVSIAGNPTFQTTVPTDREAGDYLAVSAGTFRSNLVASTDLGGTVDMTGYNWQMDGAAAEVTRSGSSVTVSYEGDWSVYSSAETLLQGYFNWTYNYDGATLKSLAGTFTPRPVYVFSPDFTYPIVIGNLAPFKVILQDDVFVVSGSRKWCTAGVDRCNVCGGDGTTCAELDAKKATPSNVGLSNKELIAIIIGTVGGALGIAAVVLLSILLRRARRAPRYDDADLIDHPQKPDYGTMAIDDIMKEGERATY